MYVTNLVDGLRISEKMFNQIVWELQNGMLDLKPLSKRCGRNKSGVDMADNVANVCAFLDAYFHGMDSSTYTTYMTYARTFGRSRTRLTASTLHKAEMEKIYKEHYLTYVKDCNNDAVPYDNFVRIRRKERLYI